MLILTRRVGQGVVFLEAGIAVSVIQSGRSLQLGIEAPREVTVLRDELLEGPAREQFETAKRSTDAAPSEEVGAGQSAARRQSDSQQKASRVSDRPRRSARAVRRRVGDMPELQTVPVR